MLVTSAKSCVAISTHISPNTKTPRPWLVLKPSHSLHIVGVTSFAPGKKIRRRKLVLFIADLTESSIGVKTLGRTMSARATSACPPPAAMRIAAPAMNHASAMLEDLGAYRDAARGLSTFSLTQASI